MSQIFLFGGSIMYGVGGQEGWGDLIKHALHTKMFAGDGGGMGQKHELYNFAKPGATIAFVRDNFESQLQQYSRAEEAIAVVSIGTNDTRAQGVPDNFVTTLPKYGVAMGELLKALSAKVKHIICVGYLPVDEAKTTPKHNPLTGGSSYFLNTRVQEFNKSYGVLSKQIGATFINFEISASEWTENYAYKDGQHPNQKGHQLIFEKVWPEVEKRLAA